MKKLLLTLLFSFISFGMSHADVTRGPLQQHPALCQYGYNPNCGQNSPPPQKIIKYVDVHVPSKYGALAFDKNTGNASGALNADSLEEAKKAAVKQCAQGGKNKNCKVVQWVRNGCVAAAGGKKGNQWVLFPEADVPGKVESLAMNSCKANGAKDCRIISPEGCSVPDGMYD